ncbi:MAG: T9SS type A sorting domain-containing protein [Paludibacter sp.]|nr:T9SS type A sorting domain-containing protein [Paludibacter sp.]
MKRIYFFLLAVLIASSGFAQKTKWDSKNLAQISGNVQRDIKDIKKASIPTKATISQDSYKSTSFSSINTAMKARKNAETDDFFVMYNHPAGTLFDGFTRDYHSYSGVYLHSPAMTPMDYVPFSNGTDVTYTWTYNGGDNNTITESPVDADGTLHFTTYITPNGYISYLPKVTGITEGGDSANYVVGQEADFQYLLAASVEKSVTDDGTDFSGTEEFPGLTLANLKANGTTDNLYGGFSAGGAFSPSYSNEDGACVGVMQIIPQLKSPLYVESISALAYENGGNAVPAGGELKLEIYYLTEDGSLGEKIGESTTNEFVKTYDVQGTFIFKFMEEEDGFEVDKPITIGTDAPVAVIITGFDSNWHFNFLFGGNSIEGSAYTLHGENLSVSTFGYSNYPSIPKTDLYIQFNGIFNCLTTYNENQDLVFPAEGGWGVAGQNDDQTEYNDVLLYSSYNLDDDQTNVWIESAPNWVTGLDYDTTYFSSNNIVSYYFQAEPLPEGTTERNGEIVISSYGVSLSIPVSQSSVTGTSNPDASEDLKVSATTNAYEISNADNYTIVNLLNVSGQTIANYNILNGQVSIPTTALSNGVYVLQFEGRTTKSIKVVK